MCTRPEQRHLYEVILEGCPCHAYFDLEYSKAANPGVCGDTLVNRLVLLLIKAFRARWGITLRKQVRVCDIWGNTAVFTAAGAVGMCHALPITLILQSVLEQHHERCQQRPLQYHLLYFLPSSLPPFCTLPPPCSGCWSWIRAPPPSSAATW
jgi:hypothetical protein